MKVTELTQAQQELLEELKQQMPGEVVVFFNKILVDLEKPSKVDQHSLAKLNALEANGVDNWTYYDDAMADLEEDDDE